MFLSLLALGGSNPVAPLQYAVYGEFSTPGMVTAPGVGAQGSIGLREAIELAEGEGRKPSNPTAVLNKSQVGSRRVVVCHADNTVESFDLPDWLVARQGKLPEKQGPNEPWKKARIGNGDLIYIPQRCEAVVVEGASAHYLLYDERSAPLTILDAYRAAAGRAATDIEKKKEIRFLVIPNALARIQLPDFSDEHGENKAPLALNPSLYPGEPELSPFLAKGDEPLGDGDVVVASVSKPEDRGAPASWIFQALHDAWHPKDERPKRKPPAPGEKATDPSKASLAFGRFRSHTPYPGTDFSIAQPRWNGYDETPLAKGDAWGKNQLPGRTWRNGVYFFGKVPPKPGKPATIRQFDLTYPEDAAAIAALKTQEALGDLRAVYNRYPLFTTNVYVYDRTVAKGPPQKDKSGAPPTWVASSADDRNLMRAEFQVEGVDVAGDPSPRQPYAAYYYCYRGLFAGLGAEFQRRVPIPEGEDAFYVRDAPLYVWEPVLGKRPSRGSLVIRLLGGNGQ